jgi:tripartite-type tricarboxylate transporter receptor subunit TctC
MEILLAPNPAVCGPYRRLKSALEIPAAQAIGEAYDLLNTEINEILTIPKFRQQLEEVGGIVRTLTPAEVRQYRRDEHERWGQIIKSSNIGPE